MVYMPPHAALPFWALAQRPVAEPSGIRMASNPLGCIDSLQSALGLKSRQMALHLHAMSLTGAGHSQNSSAASIYWVPGPEQGT